MSIKVATLVRSRIVGSPALKAVLLNMADRANDDGFARIDCLMDIALEEEVSRATLFRTIRALKERGLVSVDRRLFRIDLQAISRLPEIRRAAL